MKNVTGRAGVERVVAELDALVAQVEQEGYAEDIIELAHDELSEVKAARNALLQYGDELLPGMIRDGHPMWQRLRRRWRDAYAWLGALS